MNRVMLVGRLTTKPELRYTGSNLPYSRFSVAVNRTFSNAQGQREADFINIVVWRKQAENVCNFLNKGSLVSIEGRLQTGSYDDKDGNEFTVNEEGRLIRTMSRPGAIGKDVAMDVEALLNVARAYMIDTYGTDFESFAYAAIHNNMTTDDKKSYIIEYRNVTGDQFYFVCIYDNGVVLWSQFSDTSDVQIVE